MNDNPTTSDPALTESAQLQQLHDEAAGTAAAPNLRERVRELTARALAERRVALGDVRALVTAITQGVGSGLAARGGEMREGLKQAVSGLDDALGSAAQSAAYAIDEAVEQGRMFKETELKGTLEQLRDLESHLLDTLKSAARQSGGKLKEELEHLTDHLKITGTRTGEEVREALGRFAAGLGRSGVAGRAGLTESAEVASERLAQVASGVLEGLSESLKRHSERLRE